MPGFKRNPKKLSPFKNPDPCTLKKLALWKSFNGPCGNE
jgi:hypothetical protein